MFKFTDIEKQVYTVVTDSEGHEVLAGLTLEETESLVRHRREFLEGRHEHDPARKRYFIDLNEKYEKVRLQIIGSEHARQAFNLTQH